MERTMSTEDKIRRAEEIYNKRKSNQIKAGTTKVNIREKKDIRLLKKMTIQILVCLAIYSVFYLIKNNNYIFSEDFLNKSKEVLSYDLNFQEMYSYIMDKIQIKKDTTKEETEGVENTEKNNNITENQEDNAIGGAEENQEKNNEENSELSQMERDAISIKNSINFINPIEGTITSKFGWRNPTTSTVPRYHTGLDIANVSGTKIHSATDGDVILASSSGDFRKSSKNTNK